MYEVLPASTVVTISAVPATEVSTTTVLTFCNSFGSLTRPFNLIVDRLCNKFGNSYHNYKLPVVLVGDRPVVYFGDRWLLGEYESLETEEIDRVGVCGALEVLDRGVLGDLIDDARLGVLGALDGSKRPLRRRL